MDRSSCGRCGSKALIRDDVTGHLICSDCGALIELATFDPQIGGINTPEGTYVRLGTSGKGHALPYKEKKIFEAKKSIGEITLRLGFSHSKFIDQVDGMVDEVTDGDYGLGDWFPVLIGACACVVSRRESLPLPIAEAASKVGCDVYELGRMIMRVVDHLGLKGEFPVYDVVSAFERAAGKFSKFQGVSRDEVVNMSKQGVFLIQCAVKWSLTTGRRPLPIVAAVLVLVSELNGIEVRIEDVANEFGLAVKTLKLRYRELLKALLEVSRALPWGKDITAKNVLKNAPLVMQYMERRSMLRHNGGKDDSEHGRMDLDDVIAECLRKDVCYAYEFSAVDHDTQYFELENITQSGESNDKKLEGLKLSHECLALAYSKFLKKTAHLKSGEESSNVPSRNALGINLHACWEWWSGKSELSKKLVLRELLEKDVGLDRMPPSFVNSCLAYKKRRERINSAKQRIDKFMFPGNTDSGHNGNSQSSKESGSQKKRKRDDVGDVDWEDLVIETLLLHHVKEEEIEKGHYNTLMDLHVFNSRSTWVLQTEVDKRYSIRRDKQLE